MKFKLLTICALAALASACTFTAQPKPGSNSVKLVSSAPSSCRLLGEVHAADINGASVPYTSHNEIQQDQLVRLKNQAVIKGANVIVLTKHKTTFKNVKITQEQGTITELGKTDNDSIVNTHDMAGNAYACSANVYEKLMPAPTTHVSDAKSADE